MTVLKGNVFAIEVNGDFDVCQSLAKRLINDRRFAIDLFQDPYRFTSANSISVGRLLPQAVYPFYAYSRIAQYNEPLLTSIPSGNFGDMVGTVLAKKMGLPIDKIICGVNENKTFPSYMKSKVYSPKPVCVSPSSAMNVSHPSNFARLLDLYGGHVYDQRDERGNIVQQGIVDKEPDYDRLNQDVFTSSVCNDDHLAAIREVTIALE